MPVLFLLGSCKRDKDRYDENTVDRLVFGTYYGFCDSNCVNIYQLDNSTLGKDDSAKYGALTWAYQFTTTRLMAKTKADMAKPLLTQVPKELLSNGSITFGAPDSHDQGGVYLIVKTIGGIYRFKLDPDNTPDQSAEVVAFKQKLIATLKQLP